MEAFKLKPMTEDQVLSVVNYFDTWDTWEYSESQIWFMYWRLRANWSKIDKAEEYLEKIKKRKAESYRWNKEQEINKHLKEYRQETQWEKWVYELMRTYEWQDWRTINIWIMSTRNNELKRTHAVSIDEKENPEYFQEIIKRFNLVID